MRCIRIIPAAGLRHPRRRRRAVVAVGDVDRRQRLEGVGQLLDRPGIGDHPQLVGHVVIGRHSHVRVARGGAGQQRVDLRRMRIGHHDRAGLGVERVDLLDAVGLLDRRGELVPAHAAILVAGDGGDAGEAGLPQALPYRAVGVVVRTGVTLQHALGHHALEVIRRLGVDSVAVGVGALGQVDLGLGDVQEAPRLAPRALSRLRARQHVVGRCQHLPRACRNGAQSPKRLDECQWPLLF